MNPIHIIRIYIPSLLLIDEFEVSNKQNKG